MKNKTHGYSATPLIKKLGIAENAKIRLINPPDNYKTLLGELPYGVVFLNEKKSKKNLIHFFATSMLQLESEILLLRTEIVENGIIWISWYKKAAKIPTNITEDKIRELALKSGLVDVKVCAIDEIWSGLKLVIPLKQRNADDRPPTANL
jgi:hypothetical protein